MDTGDFDLLILGSGPAGYVGAIRASQLGMKVCVVERDALGGVCLNVGCIPSKALIRQAELFASIPALEALGLGVERSGFDYSRVQEKAQGVADTMSRGVAYLLKKNKVTVVSGTGRIVSPGEIALADGTVLWGKNILIATGSQPATLAGFETDGVAVLSSTDALRLTRLPRSMLILGGGAIGCEFAHVFNAFGVQVRIVEMRGHLLPREDAENAALLQRSFKKRGIEALVDTTATGLVKSPAGLRVSLRGGDGAATEIEVEKMLVVVGRTPNTQDIGLENIGLSTERGYLPVGDGYRTAVNGVYAAGDVVAGPLLAHVASKQAEIAVEHMAGKRTLARIDPAAIPSAVYCEPQLAGFGLTEESAAAAGTAYAKAVFPFKAAGKAVAVGRSEGQVKILFDPLTHELLGAHVIGPEATELIHELLLAKTGELLPEDIAAMIHAHPTLSEAVMETARAAEGWAIHV